MGPHKLEFIHTNTHATHLRLQHMLHEHKYWSQILKLQNKLTRWAGFSDPGWVVLATLITKYNRISNNTNYWHKHYEVNSHAWLFSRAQTTSIKDVTAVNQTQFILRYKFCIVRTVSTPKAEQCLLNKEHWTKHTEECTLKNVLRW